MIPTVHLNGTSADELIEQLSAASNALNEAYRSLQDAAPNGRDYYPQGPDALTKAINEHMYRLSCIDAVKAEIDFLAEKVVDQGVSRG